MNEWPGQFCIDVIKSEITRFEEDFEKHSELKLWLQHIKLCVELKQLLNLSNWYEAYEFCKNKTKDAVTNLLSYDKIEHLQFVVDYLLNNVKDDSLLNIQMSLKILSVFPQNEQEQLLCLISQPINIIETLVMNTKLDKLSKILNIVKSDLSSTELNKDSSIERIDQVLRTYAEKSLDFRVITQPNPRLLRTPECKLMESIDSLTFSADKGFIMPDEVPTKDEWVSNNEVLERCGRIVCYNCSLHRMLVNSYGDILVRVCNNCYELTMGDSNASDVNDSISMKSATYDYWLLTDDPEHNKFAGGIFL
ncbi:hypothetical protein NQ317_018398 [Molorchus minor]|uniref:Uncharacterized protein n=1 Tax=Molorchus minor TaxID=1323400 RepID=A0ABQ9J7B0_9CUCU|nr:hypothetical protein NQ317_018398 [Molorchus minor]